MQSTMLDDDKGFRGNVLCFSLEACIALFGGGWLPFFDVGHRPHLRELHCASGFPNWCRFVGRLPAVHLACLVTQASDKPTPLPTIIAIQPRICGSASRLPP